MLLLLLLLLLLLRTRPRDPSPLPSSPLPRPSLPLPPVDAVVHTHEKLSTPSRRGCREKTCSVAHRPLLGMNNIPIGLGSPLPTSPNPPTPHPNPVANPLAKASYGLGCPQRHAVPGVSAPGASWLCCLVIRWAVSPRDAPRLCCPTSFPRPDPSGFWPALDDVSAVEGGIPLLPPGAFCISGLSGCATSLIEAASSSQRGP